MRPDDLSGLGVELPEHAAKVPEIHRAVHDRRGRGDIARRPCHPFHRQAAGIRWSDRAFERLVSAVGRIIADHSPVWSTADRGQDPDGAHERPEQSRDERDFREMRLGPARLAVLDVSRGHDSSLTFVFIVSFVVTRRGSFEGRRSTYAHTSWLLRTGAFRGYPKALAQTVDGYLWPTGRQNASRANLPQKKLDSVVVRHTFWGHRVLIRTSQGTAVQVLGHRLRHSERTVATSARLLPHPVGHAGFTSHDLANEFWRKVPTSCEFRNGVMPLFEWVRGLRRSHDLPPRQGRKRDPLRSAPATTRVAPTPALAVFVVAQDVAHSTTVEHVGSVVVNVAAVTRGGRLSGAPQWPDWVSPRSTRL
jgi:hypothetical protein